MARLNTAASATPRSTPASALSSRANTLYRDPTPLSARGAPNRTALRETAYSTLSPSPSRSSDKENEPGYRVDKGKGSAHGMEHAGSSSSAYADSSPHSSKRRRLGEHNVPVASQQSYPSTHPVDSYVDLHFYDPDQDPELRRHLRHVMRENERELLDRRDELVKPQNEELLTLVMRADSCMREVRQTADATIDSRFLVNASDIALRQAQNQALGDGGQGLDVDEFVSKCITFMRNGGPVTSEEPMRTQRRRNRAEDEDEEDFEAGDGLDWEVLGQRACFPNNRRPPVPSFLLGPLSVQKRVRTVQRRARIERNRRVQETRPEELTAKDVETTESANLTRQCMVITQILEEHLRAAEERISAEAQTDEDLPDLLIKNRVAMDRDGEACVRLMEFATNPDSFGQTIENLFYISFLVKEGKAEVLLDDGGEAILKPQMPRSVADQRNGDANKQQSIFRLDRATWRMFIRAYDIDEPLIPHRDDTEGRQIAQRGWYG